MANTSSSQRHIRTSSALSPAPTARATSSSDTYGRAVADPAAAAGVGGQPPEVLATAQGAGPRAERGGAAMAMLSGLERRRTGARAETGVEGTAAADAVGVASLETVGGGGDVETGGRSGRLRALAEVEAPDGTLPMMGPSTATGRPSSRMSCCEGTVE